MLGMSANEEDLDFYFSSFSDDVCSGVGAGSDGIGDGRLGICICQRKVQSIHSFSRSLHKSTRHANFENVLTT
ncbi:Hypothetical predicted protein [Octopus vulgaris]|uniref:Uncharacterized protein n=1 Tax=Octopus vulgaris TaxID=6645 RepID=A0AA36F5K6_OCTVU|nr:Hypothetical predicted protein [Octopus vulgaris]